MYSVTQSLANIYYAVSIFARSSGGSRPACIISSIDSLIPQIVVFAIQIHYCSIMMDRHGQVSVQGRYDYPRPMGHAGPVPLPLSSTLRNMEPIGHKASANIAENLSFSFCVETPTLVGPDARRIAFATPGARERWLPPSAVEGANLPAYKLPYHRQNLDNLQRLCKSLSDGPEHVIASVRINETKSSPGKQTKPPTTTVSLYGDPDVVLRTRGILLESVPLKLVSEYTFLLRHSSSPRSLLHYT
jgi:hypothetical protein